MYTLFRIISILFVAQMLGAQGPPPGIDPNNELYQLGYLDITLYGADATGTDDSTDAIQDAINDARDYSLVCYFPTGTYLVSDTLTAKLPAEQLPNGNWNVDRRKPCVLVGGYPRPTLKIVDNAPAYDDPNNPLPVVWIWAEPRGDNGSIPGDNDPWEEEHGIAFNMVFKGIDIDLNNNPGAIGVHFNGAQGCTLEDVTVFANGGYSGFRGTHGGAGSGYYNIEVIGGKHGVVITDPHQSLCGTYAGAKFIDQEEEVFVLPMWSPMVITGFHIEKESGPIVSSWASRGGISFIDGAIEFTGANTSITFNVPNSKNLILNNVFVKGASFLKSNVPLVQDQWNAVSNFSYCGSGGQNLINGNINQIEISDISLGTPDINFLLEKHIWDEANYPKIEDRFDSDFVDVTDPIKMDGNEAIGDGISDDSQALLYAIDNYQKVYLPKGIYKVSEPIRLKYNTRLFGAGKTYSIIRADKDWKPADGTAIVETIYNANANTSLSWVLIESHLKENPMLTSLKWRVGENSIIRDIMMGYTDWIHPDSSLIHDHHAFEFTHFGGGRVYALTAEWTKNQAASKGDFYRGLLVNGTTEPLKFYGLNVERVQGPIQVEIRNASNVDIFFYKSEAGAFSGGADTLAPSIPILINNSCNIHLHATTGNIELEEGFGTATIEKSSKVYVDAIKGYQVGPEWNNILDDLSAVDSYNDLAVYIGDTISAGSDILSDVTELNAIFSPQDVVGSANYFWEFGDGNTSDVENPEHLYTSGGSYNVCLTVSNSCGDINTICKDIEILGPDLSPIINLSSQNVQGSSTFELVIELMELNNINTSGPVTVVIPKQDMFSINWDNTLASLGGYNLNNSIWTYDGSAADYHIWTSTAVINAGTQSNFGFTVDFIPENTDGSTSITAFVLAGSGNEVITTNNSNSKTLQFIH